MATHSSILAWRFPWTEEPGGLQSMGHLVAIGERGPRASPGNGRGGGAHAQLHAIDVDLYFLTND